MSKKLSIESMKSAMYQISQGAVSGALKALNINEADFKITTGSTTWDQQNCHIAKRTIDTLCSGTVRMMGLRPIRLSAEFVAGVIQFFCHPCNVMAMCSMQDGLRSTESMAVPGSGQIAHEEVTSEQLHALCLEAESAIPMGRYAQAWMKKTNKEIARWEDTEYAIDKELVNK